MSFAEWSVHAVWQVLEQRPEEQVRNLGASCIVVVEKEAIMSRLVEVNFHLRYSQSLT